MTSPRFNSIHKILFLALGLGLIIICLSSVLRGGLHSDDLPNFQRRSCTNESVSKGVIAEALPAINIWMKIGRITPLSFVWMELSFKYFKTIAGYKMFLLTMNLLAILAFLLLLRTFDLGINPAIWAIFFCSVIQFRLQFHDAFTGLNAQYQLLAILIFSSILFYHKYLTNKHWFYLVLSLLLYISGLMISEVGISTLLLLPFCLWLLNDFSIRVVKSFFAFLFLTVGYVAFILWIRQNLTVEHIWYDGLLSNYDLPTMFLLLRKQAYAALPLSNFDHQIAIPRILFHQLSDIRNVVLVLVLSLLAGFIFWLYKKDKKEQHGFEYKGLLFALSLMVVPALFILPSVKYQTSVGWGVGYLPVYLQVFGSATLMALLFQYCFNRRGIFFRDISYALYTFGFMAMLAAFLFNIALTRALYFEHEFATESFYNFTVSGGLNHCQEGSTIVLKPCYFWRSPDIHAEIFEECLGKKYDVQDFDQWKPSEPAGGRDCFLLESRGEKLLTMSLYNINGVSGLKDSLLATNSFRSNIELIPEERIVLHR